MQQVWANGNQSQWKVVNKIATMSRWQGQCWWVVTDAGRLTDDLLANNYNYVTAAECGTGSWEGGNYASSVPFCCHCKSYVRKTNIKFQQFQFEYFLKLRKFSHLTSLILTKITLLCRAYMVALVACLPNTHVPDLNNPTYQRVTTLTIWWHS